MPRVASQHRGRDFDKAFRNFTGGFVEDQSALVIPATQLADVMNFQYFLALDEGQQPTIILQLRPGTKQISNTAITGTPTAVGKFVNEDTYLIATASKLYYLDSSDDPVEIGDLSGTPTFSEFNQKLIVHDGGVTKGWDGTKPVRHISNGTFETGAVTGWGVAELNGADATVAIDSTVYDSGSYSLKLTIADGGSSNIMDVALSKSLTAFASGDVVKLKFRAKASLAAQCHIQLAVSDPWAVDTTFGVTLTTSWAWYEYVFTATSAINFIALRLGKQGALNFWLDNIRIEKQYAWGKLNCQFDDEILAVGNGATTKFAGTLDYQPVEPGSIDIAYTVAYLFDDDCAVDGTASWDSTEATGTLVFDTNHYEFGSTEDGEIFYVLPANIEFNEGDVCTLSIDVKYGTIFTPFRLVSLKTSGTVVEEYASYSTYDSATWQTCTLSFTATADTDSVGIQFRKDCGGDNTEIKNVTLACPSSKSIVDDAKGRMTGAVAAATAITAATAADPCQITATAHGLDDGDLVSIQGVVGMVQLNNRVFTVTKVSDDAFTIGIDSSSFPAYTSGGTASGNAIDYSTGEYNFECSSVPDDASTIECTYEEEGGAPVSRAGLVRQNRLYVWGNPTDADEKARLYYTGVNSEIGWWDSTADDYRYVGIEPDDGYELISCVNYFTRLICMKENGTFHIVGFPGDSDFAVQPVMPNVGASAYRSVIPIGQEIYALGETGLFKIVADESFGDVKRNLVDRGFHSTAVRCTNEYSYAVYNPQDGQYWLAAYNTADSEYYNYLYVLDVNLGTLSKYRFAHGHAALAYADSQLLIAGTDGHLYYLVADRSTYQDNSVSYADYSYVKLAMTDWDLPFNKKLLKGLSLDLSPRLGLSANLNIFIDRNVSDSVGTIALSAQVGDADIAMDGNIDIAELDGWDIGATGADTELTFPWQLTYRAIQFSLTDVSTAGGLDFYGIRLTQALLGKR